MRLPPDHLELLRESGLLEVEARPDFERFARLACALLGTPVALVSLIDEDRQVFLSQQGMPDPWKSGTPIEYSFCQRLVFDPRPLVVGDVFSDPEWSQHPGARTLQVGAYAGIPLEVSPGLVLGAMCVIDNQKREFSTQDLDRLQELADSVIGEIRLRLTAQALHQSQLHLDALLQQAPLGVFQLVDGCGTIRSVNPTGLALLATPADVLVGGHLEEFVLPEDRPQLAMLSELWQGGQPLARAEARFRRGDSQWFWARLHAARVEESGQAPLVLAMLEDITDYREALEQLRRQSQELEALSLTDPLTGLANRRGFLSTGHQLLLLFQRQRRPAAVVFLDLNDLKKTNDQWGHEAGDQMIQRFAEALRSTFRQADLLSRLGGDEFAVLLADVGPEEEPILLQRLEERLTDINRRTDLPYQLACSLGWAYLEGGGEGDLESMLKLADARMYADKRRRKVGR